VRRKDRLIESTAETEDILSRCDLGYLATCSSEGRPMATPVNYIFCEGRIIFHCALKGHKLENIAASPKVGFTVVSFAEIDRVNMTTYYESVMVEGTAHLIEEGPEKAEAIDAITRRLAEPGETCNDQEGRRTAIVAIEITSMSGKRNIRK